jgi:hypothetical protein
MHEAIPYAAVYAAAKAMHSLTGKGSWTSIGPAKRDVYIAEAQDALEAAEPYRAHRINAQPDLEPTPERGSLEPLPSPVTEATSCEAKALKAIAEVLDQWEHGALVNHGPYEGVGWIPPVWPLPSGVAEIRKALDEAKAATGA